MQFLISAGEKDLSDEEIHKRDIDWLTESNGMFTVETCKLYLACLVMSCHCAFIVWACVFALSSIGGGSDTAVTWCGLRDRKSSRHE